MKSGIDFFPLEVYDDRKIKLIKAEYGLVGSGVVVELWRMIYREEGYYAVWDNDVALVFAQDNNVGVNVVSEVVSSALRRDIFDKGIFDKYGVLTSRGIQRRFFDACSRRVSVKVDKRYLLLPMAEIPKNVDISSKNVNISAKNVSRNGQSKVKESKVEKSKEEYSNISAPQTPPQPSSFERFWKVYPKKKAKIEAEKAWNKINPSSELTDRIVKAVIEQRQSHDWTKEGGKFIPYPATWLNRGEWENEEVSIPQQPKKKIGDMETDVNFKRGSFTVPGKSKDELREFMQNKRKQDQETKDLIGKLGEIYGE